MAVPAVLRMACFARSILPIGTKEHAEARQAVPPDRQASWALLKKPKSMLVLYNTKSRLLLDFSRGAQRVSPVCCGLLLWFRWAGCEKVDQSPHGRDAHAPLAFASHTLSSHFRISEILRKATSVRTSCYHSLQTMKAHSYHCLFEIRLCSAKEGGMAVSAVWRLVYLLVRLPF